MLPMLDMWTDVFAVVGARTTGTGPGDYALVGPEWGGVLPAGVERIDAPTPFGWIIGRTQTNGASDYEAVNQIQDGFVATPLSHWPGVWVPDHEIDPDVELGTAVDQVNATGIVEFLAYGAELMKVHPPHLTDQPIVARMKRLGLRPGETFQPEGLGAGVLDAIQGVPAVVQQRMLDLEPHMSPVVNGWAMPTFGMGVYGTDYLRRAVVAKVGLGANLPEDAVYPVLYFDEDGSAPNGSNDYVLHFTQDGLPPVDAFWSLTIYDGEGFPVPNALDRYALGDRDPLLYNHDGSVDLHIQQDDPGGKETQNWLPAPAGPIGVTLRFYGPRPEVVQGNWTPPPLKRCH